MKNFRTFANAALACCAAFAMAACSDKATIEGTLTGTDGAEVVVQLLDVNKFQPIDTVKTSSTGSYSCKISIEEGQPEFIYLFYKGNKIASLLLEKGDKVKVVSDTLGKYTVTGSEETAKLMEVEKDEEEFANAMAATLARLDDLDPASERAGLLRQSVTRQYIDYYRDRIRYVMSNPYSLTVIPVLYQNITENMPLFGQTTDAMHFRNACDSLKTVYPESRYVKALDEEAKRRENIMAIDAKLKSASPVGFPDIELPDVKGVKTKLSEIDAKVAMVHFWTAADAAQKMFNQDVLKPLYEKYHSRGLEIYAVSLDTDKTVWASAVKNQNLPWINVCDGLGANTRAVSLYNVNKIPVTYFIADGTLTPEISDGGAKNVTKLIEKYLK